MICIGKTQRTSEKGLFHGNEFTTNRKMSVFDANLNCLPSYVWNDPGVLPIMAYTVRLRPKGVPFSGI